MPGVIIETQLEGRINNLPSFKNDALSPLFEAIVNSIHAIDDRKDLEKGKIKVSIIRGNEIETTLGDYSEDDSLAKSTGEKKIVAFEIEDNGIGFDDDNFKSFNTADSTYKLDRGGKGIGRFLWLVSFERVEIESIYGDNGTKRLRTFEFTKKKWVVSIRDETLESDKELRTRVKLIGFKEEYRSAPSAYKTTKKIAQRILEHCLSYYIGGTVPTIVPTIIVSDGKETYNLDELYAKIKKDSFTEDISILGEEFSVTHLKLFETNNKVHNIVLCADKRDVDSYPIQSLLGTSALYETDDDGDKFYYSAYVSSKYLDQHVGPTRTFFHLPREGDLQKNLDGTRTISLSTIKNAVIQRIKLYLATYLEALQEKKKNRVATFVNSYPPLRSIPLYCPEIFDEIEPNSSDEKIYEVLYKFKGAADSTIQQKTKKLLDKKAKTMEEFEKEYEELNKTIEDFRKDELASYICRRKVCIDLLDKRMQICASGEYTLEAEIHDILFPQRYNTDEIRYEDHNLWIISEQLTFHEFAASDLELHKISSSDSAKRPDIIVFSETGEDRIARSISIVELKRPERKDFDVDPVSQMYDIIRDIQGRQVKLQNGRYLLVGEATKYYCYAICDINQKIKKFAENLNFRELKDGLGYYSFNDKFNAYIEIIAFDRLITDVKKRHKIFFHKLGIPDL